MGRKYLRLLALMGACACLTSCSLLPEEEVIRTAPVLTESRPEVYKTAAVQRGDLVKNDKVSARYVPVQKESVSFALLGEYVDRMMVNVGDNVVKGQLLGQLRMDDIEQDLEAAQDAIVKLELQLAYLEQNYALALRRSEVETDGQSPDAVRKAREAVEESFDAQRSALEDQIALSELSVENLQREIEKRQIRAPFAGTVTFVREFEDGYITEYAHTAVTIADSTVTVFRAETSNWQVFNEGDRHVITVKGEEHELEVVSEETLGISVTEKVEGKKGYVYFRMLDPILGLEDGDYGTIELEMQRRDDVLYIPSSAVRTAGDIQLVYYVREDGLKGYKEIQTGATIGKYTEITGGLEEGEEIIAD